MLVELSTVARMLFARREITKFPANVPLDTREMLGLHVIQVSFQADNRSQKSWTSLELNNINSIHLLTKKNSD